MISRNSETPTFFTRALTLVNLPLLPGALLFDFPHAIASNIIYLDCNSICARNFETATLYVRALALVNLPLLLGTLLFEFESAIASNIIYLAKR